jgi:hypothetical protein
MEQPKKKRRRSSRLKMITEAQMNGMLPLDYLLSVIRDETADKDRRDRMAIAAAPYCHPRLIPVKPGKKQRVIAEAATAGIGTQWARDLEFENRSN